jgi:DNA-binding MurR/RpiR family transcriptional regulator
VILLGNIEKVKKMFIREVADHCYVSQPSISRFCRYMGFISFKEFHSMLSKEFSMNNDYSINYISNLKHDQKAAIENYEKVIIENIHNSLDPENLKNVENIARVIHDSKTVTVFSHHFLYDIGVYLQSKMIMMDKYIHACQTYDNQLSDAMSLTKEDTAIIFTIGGTYFTRYNSIWDAISSSGCTVIVVTQNQSSTYLNTVNYILK